MFDKYSDDAARIARCVIDMASSVKAEGGMILVFPHRSVDGDCIGSSCGMCSALRSLGVKAYVAMPESLPENMAFMGVDDLLFVMDSDSEEVKAFKESLTIDGHKFTGAVAVDISESGRMGVCGEFFDKCPSQIIVDHHASVDFRGDNMWIDPDASSASELVYYVLTKIAELTGKAQSEIIDSRAALVLISGMVTDTGRFTYKNTHPETLISAGELMTLGGDISVVCYNLFDRKKMSKFNMSAAARSRAEFLCDGRFAISFVPYSLFVEMGADSDGVDDVVSALRDVDGVEVAIVLRELANGEIRGNVRSNDNFNSAEFASLYGGGGHFRAAGFTAHDIDIEVLAEDVKKRVVALL